MSSRQPESSISPENSSIGIIGTVTLSTPHQRLEDQGYAGGRGRLPEE